MAGARETLDGEVLSRRGLSDTARMASMRALQESLDPRRGADRLEPRA
jgi:hypothetical protein